MSEEITTDEQIEETPGDFKSLMAGIEVADEWVGPLYPVDLNPQIDAAEMAVAEATVSAQEAEASSDAAGQRKFTAEASKHAREVKRLREEMESFALRFRVTIMDPDDWQELTIKGFTEKIDTRYEQLSVQVVEVERAGKPYQRLTAEEWKTLGKAIGVGQFNEVYSTANRMMQRRVVLPDFSRTTSDALAKKGTSRS